MHAHADLQNADEANRAFKAKKAEEMKHGGASNDAVWDFLAEQGGSVVGGITRGPLLGTDGYVSTACTLLPMWHGHWLVLCADTRCPLGCSTAIWCQVSL